MGICDSFGNGNTKISTNNNNNNGKTNSNYTNEVKTCITKELTLKGKPVPVDLINEVLKSICKIIVNNNPKKYGTGFFMYYKSLKVLISNYHVISPDLINKNIEIVLCNRKKIYLNLDNTNRYIKFFKKPIDISVIEIKDSDGINNDINYLKCDLNFQKGYSQYKNEDLICIGHPSGGGAAQGSGKIIERKKNGEAFLLNDYEFAHDIPTDNGSSGSPIILFNKSVIGIHKYGNIKEEINVGTFIGIIFNEIEKYFINYIIAEIVIDYDINKNIGIINSYEESKRNSQEVLEEENYNEKEIKQCEIEINGTKRSFNYYFNFPAKGKYTIKYIFKNYLTKTNYMFSGCSNLINIDLSNFNTKNVISMSNMFSWCKSLTKLNLSKFNTQNVINMSKMFSGCQSLAKIDLSNFNTQNVTDMSEMFSYCSSIKDINLSNFNTQKITNMSEMFSYCSSITNINLSNFNTVNVTDMREMFSGCKSLISINISNFNTQNVIDMRWMFSNCESLKNLNLSNFVIPNGAKLRCMFSGCTALINIDLSNLNAQNADDINNMFFNCNSLKKQNLKSKDLKILQEYDKKQ